MSTTKSGRGGGWFVAVGLMVLAGGLAGCAGAGSQRLEHAKPGYSISNPAWSDASEKAVWHRLKVKHADFAYRGPSDSMMAISSRCKETQTDPVLLGRQLLIGLQQRTRLTSERFEFAGGQAFSQVVESHEDGVSVRTKTVTLVRSGCVIDWVLAAPDYPPEVEEAFDLWWQGFDASAMAPSDDSPGEGEP
jgi:hypothetical protein